MSLKSGHCAIILFFPIFFIIAPVLAEMRLQTDADLKNIYGGVGAGISVLESSLSVSSGAIKITGGILLEESFTIDNITLDNGSSAGFSFNTPDNEQINLELDINEENEYARLILNIPDISSGSNLPHLNTGDISLNTRLNIGDAISIDLHNVFLGNFSAENIGLTRFEIRYDMLETGPGLFNMDMALGLNVAGVQFVYNTAGDAVGVNNLYLAESFSGAPENPSDWNPAGSFSFGELGVNPVFFNAGAEPDPYVEINLPANGSLRVENVTMGGNDFGPCAIDGIDLHSFTVRLPEF